MGQSVVVFELNEVPWRILDWWCDAHPTSAIASLLHRSQQWTTVAADEGHLSPWVTWPTVHRGVSNTDHGIAHFGQDVSAADADYPTWFRSAAEAGASVGVFGLLHTAPVPSDPNRFEFWVPDTFAPDPDTHPTSLRSFQAFNLSMARASARNVSTGIDARAAASFLSRAPLLGLRPSTVSTIVRQLADERRTPERRVRRRTLQSVLVFDLFMGQVRRARPEAAAFFTNHVASAMHRYWAATFPGDYDPATFGFDDAWINRWSGEIDAAMAQADRMLGRVSKWCDRTGSLLVVTSSMGQQAAQGTPVGRQLYLRDVGQLLAAAGVSAFEQRPAMDPQVSVVVPENELAGLRAFLGQLTVGGQPTSWEENADGFVSMTFGQADDAIGDVEVAGKVVPPASLGLVVEEIEDEVASTGYHVPEGSLWVYDPTSLRVSDTSRPEVPTTAIAPALLEHLEVPLAPHHDTAGLSFR